MIATVMTLAEIQYRVYIAIAHAWSTATLIVYSVTLRGLKKNSGLLNSFFR